jgi:hypothetical protein
MLMYVYACLHTDLPVHLSIHLDQGKENYFPEDDGTCTRHFPGSWLAGATGRDKRWRFVFQKRAVASLNRCK